MAFSTALMFDDYARAVYAATDAYLATVGDDDLAKTTFGPGGEMPVLRFLAMNLNTLARSRR